MDTIIVYPNDNGGVVFVYPCECGLTLSEIASKDVPAGKPYIFVHDDYVPKDHTFFEAFEADFSNPDGYGIGSQTWFINKFQAELATLDPVRDQYRISELNQLIAVQQAELAGLVA